MLKYKYLDYEEELAISALKMWVTDPEERTNLFQYFRISSNAVYPFPGEKGVCFLRIAPVEEKRLDNIIGELEFLEYLNEHDYPALKFVKSLNGNKYELLQTANGNYYVCVFERVKGQPIEDIEYSKEVMFEYGKRLGELHKLSSGFKQTVKNMNHTDVMQWIYQELTSAKNQECAIAEWNDVNDRLNSLEITDTNYGLIHYDFQVDNVFYDVDTKSCYAIDFEDSMYHWYVTDIVSSFDSMEDIAEGEKLEEAKKIFMEGYETEYSLDETMKEQFALFARFHDLYSYARILHVMSEPFEPKPDWMKEIEGIITDKQQTIMAKWAASGNK